MNQKILPLIIFLLVFANVNAQVIHYKKGGSPPRFVQATPPPPPPFDPGTLGDSLIAWYDVTDPAAITLSDDTLTELLDKSNTGRDITAKFSSTSFPVYSSTGGANDSAFITIDSLHTLTNSDGYSGTNGTIAFAVVRLKHTAPVLVSGSYLKSIITYADRSRGLTSDSLTAGVSAYTQSGGSISNGNYHNGAHTDWQVISWKTGTDTTITRFNNEPNPITCITDLTGGGPTNINFGYFAFTQAYEFAELLICKEGITDEQETDVRNYLLNKYSPTSQPYLLTFGNSLTANTCGNYDSAWVYRVSDSLGINLVNMARGGTIVEPNATATGVDGRNLSDVYPLAIGKQKAQWLTFMFGVNDATQGGVDATWKTLYKAIIQEFIDDGYNADSIIIVIPPSTAARQSLMSAANTYISEIASEMGLRLFDANTLFLGNGGDALFEDTLHPNGTGNLLFRDGIIAVMNE